MQITACPRCGSTRIFQGRLKEGVLTGFFDSYVCRDCGYHGAPIIFDNINNYKKFLKEIKQDKDINLENKSDNSEISNLSNEEREIIDFLKEYEKDSDYKDKKIDKKITKNPVASLGFILFVMGILVTFISYYYTILLIFLGILLGLIGFFGPSEEALQREEYKEKMKKLPKIAGIILIINALVNGFLYLGMLVFVLMYERFYEIYGHDRFNEVMLLMGENQSFFIAVLLIELIFCLLLLVGGIFALLRRKWGVAILGSFFGIFLIQIFYIPCIVSFIGLVLIGYSRFIFEK